MHKRIEEVRKYHNLTRAAFGEKIGVSGDVINNLERGRVEIKEHIIRLICMQFNVNEEWLRTGNGNMLIDFSREEEIANILKSLLLEEDDSYVNRLVSSIPRLTVAQLEVLAEVASTMAKKNEE